MKLSPDFLGRIAGCALVLTAHFALAQGNLNPPGPPGPTMKTLAQIEPRIPISSLPFSITAPGAYYLTGNLAGVAGRTGITVQADNVTLDLGGFTLSGTAGSLAGIAISGTQKNFVLRNGTVTGWNLGVDALDGNNCLFEALRVSDNRGDGLIAGVHALVRDCAAHSNTGSGIVADPGSILKDCIARANQTDGIRADTGSQLAGCSASFNTRNGFMLADSCVVRSCIAMNNGSNGISGGADNVIEDCSALSNNAAGVRTDRGATIKSSTSRSNAGDGIRVGAAARVADCTSSFNTQAGFAVGPNCQLSGCNASENKTSGIVAEVDVHIVECAASKNVQLGFSTGNDAQILDSKAQSNGGGIVVGQRSTVRGCSVQGNAGDGITISSECTVAQNDCKNNFNARDAAGIRAVAVDNWIKENSVIANDRGISVEGAGNLVIRNSAANNTLNYFFLATQTAGPIVISTNDLSFLNPWANLQY